MKRELGVSETEEQVLLIEILIALEFFIISFELAW